jgi:hypothetical protein
MNLGNLEPQNCIKKRAPAAVLFKDKGPTP